MDEQTEQGWVGKARAGDAAAFAELVRLYWRRIHAWLHALTRHRQRAEDLTQEVFLRAWSALGGLRSEHHFRPWLFRIARNCVTDSQRQQPATPDLPLDEGLAASGPEPLDQLVARENLALVLDACARLPLTYRAPLLLWTQEGMGYAEIAESLGIAEGVARWRVCKARRRLLRELGSHLDLGRRIPP